MLNYQVFGTTTENPTLIIAHGLFGSGRNWRAIARNLSTNREVITVDMRNHGDSFWDDDNTYKAMAADLVEVILKIGSPVDLMGHSMGGKASMIAALDRPDIIHKLMVIDIAPVAYQHSQNDHVETMQSLSIDSITRRSQADELLATSISQQQLRSFFLQSLVISETGNSWQLNLNALHSNMHHIVGFPEITGTFDGPTLFLRGGLSSYVKDHDLPKIKRHFPSYKLQTIESAGHWLHAEATRRFLEEINNYLT